MGSKVIKYKKIILGALMLIWFIPLFQGRLHLLEEKELKGDFKPAKDTSFSLSAWFDGGYGANKEKYMNDQFGFRSFFVRLKSQIYYSFFNKASAEDIVIGKDGFLFEEKYISSYYGKDFVGTEKIKQRIEMIKFIQDTLKKLNKDLIILFAPGKASFYPEYIPDKYKIIRTKTNYEENIRLAKKSGINYIDYSAVFLKLKNSAKYPLYPKTGTHWSLYSMYFVQDSLNKYIENLRKIKLRKFEYDKVIIADTLVHPDDDMEAALNLFSDLPHFKMAYPLVKPGDTTGTAKINLCTIADSYWMGIYYTHVPQMVYKKHSFWYYNKIIYDYFGEDENKNPVDLDLKNEINKYDVFCIMAAEVNTKQIGWGFVEDAYKLFKYGQTSASDRKYKAAIDDIIRHIYETEKWFKEIQAKAKLNNIPLDSMITLDAVWVYNQLHK